MELTIKISIPENMMTKQAAQIANRMNDYSCRILLRRQNVTVNAKSLMGVLSAGLSPSLRRARTRHRRSAN